MGEPGAVAAVATCGRCTRIIVFAPATVAVYPIDPDTGSGLCAHASPAQASRAVKLPLCDDCEALIRAHDHQFLSWPAARAAWPCPAGICNTLSRDTIPIRKETPP
jgi:hypothetical protein